MKWFCAIVTGSCLVGCAGPRPDVPPAAAVNSPIQWRQETSATTTSSESWWQQFHDPVLGNFVEAALLHNSDVEIAAEHVAIAHAKLDSANANLLPNVTGSLEGGRDEEVSPIGTPAYNNSAIGELHAVYDPDFSGQLHDLEKAARAGLFSSTAQQANVRLMVASTTAITYIELLAADARLRVLRDTLVARQESFKYAGRRAQSGYSTQLELRQAEAELHAAEQLIPSTELSIAQLQDALSELIGENPEEIARASSIEMLEIPQVPVRLPAELLRRRPDVMVAEQRIVAADSELDSARAAFMPHVELTASGGSVYSTLIVANPIKLFQIGGSILAPIFDAGRLRAQEDIAIARRDEAAFEYRKAALSAFKEVEDALAAQSKLGEEEVAMTAQRDALAKALVIAKNRYRTGYSPYLEQLDAERSLLAIALQLAQLRADRLSQSVRLYQAVGGDWGADRNSAARPNTYD